MKRGKARTFRRGADGTGHGVDADVVDETAS
jgi:hypothetical protein